MCYNYPNLLAEQGWVSESLPLAIGLHSRHSGWFSLTHSAPFALLAGLYQTLSVPKQPGLEYFVSVEQLIKNGNFFFFYSVNLENFFYTLEFS